MHEAARRQDPASGTVDIDFVLHGDGPAAAWAAAAEPGRMGSLVLQTGDNPLSLFWPASTTPRTRT